MVKDVEEAGKFFADLLGDLLGIEFGAPWESKVGDTRNIASDVGIELISSLTQDGPTARTL